MTRRGLLVRSRAALALGHFAAAIAGTWTLADRAACEDELLIVAQTGSTHPEKSADDVIDELLRGEATPHTRGLDPPVAPMEHPAKPPNHRRPVNPPDVGGTRNSDDAVDGDADY